MNTVIELLKDAVEQNRIVVDDPIFELIEMPCQVCCMEASGGNVACPVDA